MGGFTSTETTNLRPTFAAKALFCSRGHELHAGLWRGRWQGPRSAPSSAAAPIQSGPLARRTLRASAEAAALPSIRAAAAMRRTCSGVVPQQPPMSLTPSLHMRRAKTPKYSGVET